MNFYFQFRNLRNFLMKEIIIKYGIINSDYIAKSRYINKVKPY